MNAYDRQTRIIQSRAVKLFVADTMDRNLQCCENNTFYAVLIVLAPFIFEHPIWFYEQCTEITTTLRVLYGRRRRLLRAE